MNLDSRDIKGVIQVSRKGPADSAGLTDVSDGDAAGLRQLAEVAGRHLQRLSRLPGIFPGPRE